MRRIVMVVIALVCVIPVFAQMGNERVELAKLDPDAREFVSTWLNRNCGVEEQERIEERIKGLGEEGGDARSRDKSWNSGNDQGRCE